MSKYRNIPTRVDGILFHSGKEARRYQELKALQAAGVITGLELQKRFHLDVAGVHICDYICDFAYHDNERRQDVVEDVKGRKGGDSYAMFTLKKKLMLAVHSIEVEET